MTMFPSKPHNMRPRDAWCLNIHCHQYRQIVTVNEPGERCLECNSLLITIVKSNIDELVKRNSQST